MARPSVPLIVRPTVLQRALDLIEEVGYEQFSLPRLAKILGVQPPSLYHHFASRAELLDEAALSVLRSADLPPLDDISVPWPDLCLESARAFRDLSLARPQVAPLIVHYLAVNGMPNANDRAVQELHEHGISDHDARRVIEGLERITLGLISVEVQRTLARGTSDAPRGRSDEEIFVDTIRAFLVGVDADMTYQRNTDRRDTS
ncbi:TetR/AcrR family transcriptional regulator [Cumulibacter soli]|uniref:TetR/AcrR family transcriptional regulator n=1 Tax=Cumulibacter soli TaxID=2546344 RepID=UPI001ABA28F6|nr:TetR/AcrR family transcriptional regulator [Cumulibacter soli]